MSPLLGALDAANEMPTLADKVAVTGARAALDNTLQRIEHNSARAQLEHRSLVCAKDQRPPLARH